MDEYGDGDYYYPPSDDDEEHHEEERYQEEEEEEGEEEGTYQNKMEKIAEEIAAEKRQLEEDSKSSKELMQECAEEWNSVMEICKLLWSSAKDKLKVDARSSENKERILNLIFTCSSIEPLFKKSRYLSILEDKPYDWIENWKKTTQQGGKGIVVGRSSFRPVKGQTLFKNVIMDNQIKNTINSQVKDTILDEIVPPNMKYIDSVRELFNNEQYENDTFKEVGEVVVKITDQEQEDITTAFRNMSISSKKYGVDNLIDDLSNKLKIEFNPNQRLAIKNTIRGETKKSDVHVNVTTLLKPFTNRTKVPILTNKPSFLKKPERPEMIPLQKGDTKKKMVSKVTDMLSQSRSTSASKISSDYSVGVEVSDRGFVKKKYSDKIEFLEPYADPHFKFLNETIEYWVPKIHLVSGKRVYREKEEILRSRKEGIVVYIKYQNVKVWVQETNNYIYVSYFRKFIDFNDFLKAWQETYVKQYYDIGKRMMNIKIEYFYLKRLKNDLFRRKYLKYKIEDIKKYFMKENASNKSEKLGLYLSDKIVNNLLESDDLSIEENVYSALINSVKGEKYRKYDNVQKIQHELISMILEQFPQFYSKIAYEQSKKFKSRFV